MYYISYNCIKSFQNIQKKFQNIKILKIFYKQFYIRKKLHSKINIVCHIAVLKNVTTFRIDNEKVDS